MTQEDKRKLEEKVEGLRKDADQAAEAVAADPGNDDLQKKAEAAEDAYDTAKAELDAAVVDDEEPKDPIEDGGEHIDFEEELKLLENGGTPPPPPGPPAPLTPEQEREKAGKALYHNAKRFKELGGDVVEALKNVPGVVPPVVVPPTDLPPPVPPVDPNNVTKEDLVEIEFGKVAKSDAERKVYMHHYKHSIQKTGNLASDMENAMLIANKGRILRSFSEIKRGSVPIPQHGTPPGTPPPVVPKVPQVSSQDASVLRRRGFKQQPDGSWKGKKYTLKHEVGKGWIQTKNA